MKKNYLLNNSTAQKLYIDISSSTPVICTFPVQKPNTAMYENIADAFLLNDQKKLELISSCNIEGASDFERFRKFCTVLPDCIGNPLYILSHIELKMLWDCDLTINPENCETIWSTLNEKIAYSGIGESELTNQAHLDRIPYLPLSTALNSNADTLASLETEILSRFDDAELLGCRLAADDLNVSFDSPNPHTVNEILKKRSQGECLSERAQTLLNMQIRRIFAALCRERGWRMLVPCSAAYKDILEYFKKSNVLPKIDDVIFFVVGNDTEHLAREIRATMRNGAIGGAMVCAKCTGNARDIAMQDYLRRTLCTVLGEIYEREEYFEDYDSLRLLSEKILYRNLKNLKEV